MVPLSLCQLGFVGRMAHARDFSQEASSAFVILATLGTIAMKVSYFHIIFLNYC